jgi:hypothetical protein
VARGEIAALLAGLVDASAIAPAAPAGNMPERAVRLRSALQREIAAPESQIAEMSSGDLPAANPAAPEPVTRTAATPATTEPAAPAAATPAANPAAPTADKE